MTVLAQPTSADAAGAPGDMTLGRRSVFEHVTVLLAVAFVALPLAHAGGGRDAGWAALTLVLVAVAVGVTRPWEHVGAVAIWIAVGLTGCALLVLVISGVGRAGSVAAVDYGLAAAMLLVVVAYARTPTRRRAVASLLALGAVAQFGWALVPWWGGENPAVPMIGTYYWHNQFAAALIAPALLALALVIDGRPIWRSVGAVAAPVSVAGVVFSTSRASMATLLVGWVALLVLGVLASRNRRRAVTRALVVTVASLALVWLLPGPPLFQHRASAWQGTESRAAGGETLASNTAYRTEFWREAVSVAQAHPVTGAGYGRMAAAAHPLTPTGWALSPLAHSGVLQAFADGGVPLGLLTLGGLGLLGLGLVRRRMWTGGGPPESDLVSLGAGVATLGLVAHSLVDVDWSYPALAAAFGVVAGLALARDQRSAARDVGRAGVVAGALLTVLLVVGAAAAWGEPFHINVWGTGQSMGGR